MFKEATRAVTKKVLYASLGWGLGMVLMILYGLLILALQQNFNYIFMLGGAMVFMIFVFYFTDLWWHYEGLKKCARMNIRNCRPD